MKERMLSTGEVESSTGTESCALSPWAASPGDTVEAHRERGGGPLHMRCVSRPGCSTAGCGPRWLDMGWALWGALYLFEVFCLGAGVAGALVLA